MRLTSVAYQIRARRESPALSFPVYMADRHLESYRINMTDDIRLRARWVTARTKIPTATVDSSEDGVDRRARDAARWL